MTRRTGRAAAVGRVAADAPPLERFLRAALRRVSYRLVRCAEGIDELLVQRRLHRVGAPTASAIRTWTRREELRGLYTLAAALPRGARALEIGSYLGASTCYLAAGLSEVGGHLFCVDTWDNETMPEGRQDTFALFERNTHGVRSLLTVVRKPSSELVRDDIDGPLSLVFIDGDHRYEAVRGDFERVRDWLAPDGIVAFHDVSNHSYEGVTRVLGEALASGEWTLAGFRDMLAWIKRARWAPPAWLRDP